MIAMNVCIKKIIQINNFYLNALGGWPKFSKTKLDYSIAPQDYVGTCLLIGRTKSTAENTNIGLPIIDLLSHNGAYIRDKEVFDFYYKNLPDEDYHKNLMH